MAIGPIHLAWLVKLAATGQFRNLASVIDIGPRSQKIQIERPVLESATCGLLSPERQVALLDAQKSSYELFGLSRSQSVDIEVRRATYRHDLNWLSGLRQLGSTR